LLEPLVYEAGEIVLTQGERAIRCSLSNEASLE
jgi:hypothetical protein